MSETFFDFSFELPLDDKMVDTTAAAISALLRGSPYTKAVTEEQIVAELLDETGIAAYDEHGNAAGYIAARPCDPINEATFVPGDEPITFKDVPHFIVGSLVVHPDHRGKGLGDTLINMATLIARSRLRVARTTAYFALASAVATPTSQRLFARNYFWPTTSAEIAVAHGYTLSSPLPHTKLLMNSVITDVRG